MRLKETQNPSSTLGSLHKPQTLLESHTRPPLSLPPVTSSLPTWVLYSANLVAPTELTGLEALVLTAGVPTHLPPIEQGVAGTLAPAYPGLHPPKLNFSKKLSTLNYF